MATSVRLDPETQTLIRRLARQTRFPEVRQELFDLAEGFDRMAEFAEKWHTADRQP